MRELNLQEIEQVNGGAIPLLVGWGLAVAGGFGIGALGAWIVS